MLSSPPRFWITLNTSRFYLKYLVIITNNHHVWNESLALLGNTQLHFTVYNFTSRTHFTRTLTTSQVLNSSLILILLNFSLSELVPVREIKSSRATEVSKESQGKLLNYVALLNQIKNRITKNSNIFYVPSRSFAVTITFSQKVQVYYFC